MQLSRPGLTFLGRLPVYTFDFFAGPFDTRLTICLVPEWYSLSVQLGQTLENVSFLLEKASRLSDVVHQGVG